MVWVPVLRGNAQNGCTLKNITARLCRRSHAVLGRYQGHEDLKVNFLEVRMG